MGFKNISNWAHESYSGGITVKGTNTNMSLKPSKCYDIEKCVWTKIQGRTHKE